MNIRGGLFLVLNKIPRIRILLGLAMGFGFILN